jgi:hypothetical protein
MSQMLNETYGSVLRMIGIDATAPERVSIIVFMNQQRSQTVNTAQNGTFTAEELKHGQHKQTKEEILSHHAKDTTSQSFVTALEKLRNSG